MPHKSKLTATQDGVVLFVQADQDSEPEQIAWEMFCAAHPQEAFKKNPDGFWEFFRKQCPNVSRERMEKLMEETEEQ